MSGRLSRAPETVRTAVVLAGLGRWNRMTAARRQRDAVAVGEQLLGHRLAVDLHGRLGPDEVIAFHTLDADDRQVRVGHQCQHRPSGRADRPDRDASIPEHDEAAHAIDL